MDITRERVSNFANNFFGDGSDITLSEYIGEKKCAGGKQSTPGPRNNGGRNEFPFANKQIGKRLYSNYLKNPF